MNKQNILSLNSRKLKKYFLKGNRYCRVDLPLYFSFDKILQKIAEEFKDNKISCFFNEDKKLRPEKLKDVNYKLFNNKDGKYAWRLLELIHPVIYVSLVHEITKEKKLKHIKDKFDEWQKIENIECKSIPLVENKKQETILNWWKRIEQSSIKLSLEYKYVFHTDIVDCYGSIYTHSIPWALHGKEESKDKKNSKELIGNIIDWHIRMMRYGQTNGIPQGSVLMDFIAEMVLGYADELLSEKIGEEIKDFKILRYRDDYRIFTNNVNDGEKILKALSEVLSGLSMRLKAEKTAFSEDVVESSVKKDKLFAMRYLNKNFTTIKMSDKLFAVRDDISKQLLSIKEISNRYPNSGALEEPIFDISKKIEKRKKIKNADIILALVVDLMYRNPRVYQNCSPIISQLLFYIIQKKKAQLKIIDKIIKKFENLPNTEVLDIWLQRITFKIDKNREYQGELCKEVKKEDKKVKPDIWDNSWLKYSNKFMEDIIDRKKIKEMPEVMGSKEAKPFGSSYYTAK